MIKKGLLLATACVGVTTAAVAINGLGTEGLFAFPSLFSSVSHSLLLDQTYSTEGNGLLSLHTNEGNEIDVTYNGITSASGKFGVVSDGGFLKNEYQLSKDNRNAIGRLSSIEAVFDGELLIDYSWGGEISSDIYLRSGITLTSGVSYIFNNEKPNYFRIRSVGETTLESVSLHYDCGTNYGYPDQYVAIRNESDLKAFRDAVNAGDKYSGKTVYVTEDIQLTEDNFGDPIGNADTLPFSGIFDGLGHTISGLTETSGTALGLFSRVTNGIVRNLKLDDISIQTSDGTRASGLVARVVDSRIENIEILSGQISGKSENGGVVGAVVKGNDKTVVKNCINRASVTGTTGGGNGGVVGFAHSGALEITNCLNYGDVTSTSTKTTGGILGSCASTDVVSVSHCYVDGNAIIKNATIATALTGASASVIYSGSIPVNEFIGRFDTAINDAASLRSFLSGSSNGVVILTNDIDLNDVTNLDDTDYSRGTTFAGTFDGLGHQIAHFKTKAATAALFKGVTGGKVTNILMKDVSINSTSTRGASIVSRLENGTISEITTYGDVRGVVQNGGIIGVVVNSNTIKKCVNYASVQGSGKENGGIVAFAATSATSFELVDCENYGNISGGGITNGGIMGATCSNGTGKNWIHDCINYGNVTGTQYSGGIIGLARENSHKDSKIQGCINYGDVTTTGNVSCGGVAGLTRFSIVDCQCYENAMIKMGPNSSTAGTLNEVGGVAAGVTGGGAHRGSIAGTTGNGASALGSLLERGCGEFNEIVANANTSINQAYGRISMLGNGKSILTLANRFSVSSRQGIDSYETLVNRDTAVSKGGFGYDYVPGYEGDSEYKLWLANMEPLYLDDGRLFIFYRTDSKEIGSGTGVYYSSIRAIESRDNGQTWLSQRHIIFENYTTDYYNENNNIRGAYEPFAVVQGDKLQIFIAFDAASTRAGGLGPDNSAFICKDYYQNLLRIPVDISNMGFEVGSVAMAIKGVSSYRRPGMPSIVQLLDGSYAMVLEHNGSDDDYANYGMRIAISYSHDLITWTTPRIIISPSVSGIYRDYDSIRYLCGAPYIQILSDGHIVVSYTTNEFYTSALGYIGDVAYFKTVEVAVSDNVISYGSVPAMRRQNAIDYADDHGARFGGCKVIDDQIILIANEYQFEKGEGENWMRTVGRGTVFSVSKYTR